MKKLNILLRIVLIFVFSFMLQQTAQAQSRTERILINEAKRITKDDFPFSSQTAKGVLVFSVNKPSAQMIEAIDKGLSDLFAVARKNNYTQRLNYSDYTIFIANPDRLKDINNQYSPDIAVGAAQYAGSIYDKGGYIYAAGMVLAYNPCAFIIGEHTRNFERVSEVARYEGEHLILYHNDRHLYNRTADHSKGSGHPILQ